MLLEPLKAIWQLPVADGDVLLRAQMKQGEALGRSGVVTVEVRGDPLTGAPHDVRIRGDAAVVFQAEIRIQATHAACSARR